MDFSKGTLSTLFVLVAVVAVIAYGLGETNGQEQLLDRAYISWCETNGLSCYLETKLLGEVWVDCNEYKKCLLITSVTS